MKLKDFRGQQKLTDLKDVELIRDLQTYLAVDADGIVGNQTIAAFGRFKRDNYLGGQGLLGETTAKSLLEHKSIASAATSNAAFKRALAFALRWEGGYSNHPSDTGGETNKGITWRTYNAYRHSKGLPIRSVRYLTQEELEAIYHLRYWIPAGCDDLPPLLALCHFDWAVNAGVGRSQATMRQACGGLSVSRALGRGEKTVVHAYNSVRESYYRAWGRGSQAVFLAGWLNRLSSVRRAVA